MATTLRAHAPPVPGAITAVVTDGEPAPAQRLLALLREQRADVVAVLRDDRLAPERSVREHVAGGRERVAGVLDAMGLTGLEDRRPRSLSPCMRRRAALARALALEPAVLLVDEPGDGLDDARASLLRELIRHAHHDRGGTYVVATRSPTLARRVGDHVAILHGGRLELV